IGALDDFSFELRQDLRQGLLKVRPLVATIGKELFQERVHPEKGRKKQDAAIAILDIGRMNDGVQQQTQRVYENMALLPLDLFAGALGGRDQWFDMRPFIVGQVTRISQFAAVVTSAVLRRPHRWCPYRIRSPL